MAENKQLQDFIKKLKSGEVYTHGGVFHADDVLSVALINRVCDKYGIDHPHVNRIFNQQQAQELAENNVVFDIGMGEYDHHQKDNESRENGVPYAAFGKIWRTVGPDLVGDSAAEKIDRTFVQAIDATDNGREPNLFSITISTLNPNWDSPEKPDDAFAKAVAYASTAFEATIESVLATERAEAIVQEAADKMQDGIMVLDQFCPWMDYVQNNVPETNFVVWPSNRGGYNIQTVPKLGERQGKIVFPEEWLGNTDEARGMTFCHPGNFLAAFNTEEQAIQAGLDATEAHIKAHTIEIDKDMIEFFTKDIKGDTSELGDYDIDNKSLAQIAGIINIGIDKGQLPEDAWDKFWNDCPNSEEVNVIYESNTYISDEDIVIEDPDKDEKSLWDDDDSNY